MDMEVTKESIVVSSYSWAVQNQQITVHMEMQHVEAEVEHVRMMDEVTCCWGVYWGCEDYPGYGGYGLCSNEWTKGCNEPADCPAPPAPAPSPANDCSGSYQESNSMRNNHPKYEGGPGNRCTIYWDNFEGWVLNDGHDTNDWVASGGKTYKFPTGNWHVRPTRTGVKSCGVSATDGDL